MEKNLFIEKVIDEQKKRLFNNKEYQKYLGISAPTLMAIKAGKPIFVTTARKICNKLKITNKEVIASINIKYYN